MHIVKNTDVKTPDIDMGGERIYELVNASAKGGNVQNHSIIRLELDPGVSSPRVPHFHKKSEETYVVLSGMGLFTVGQKSEQLLTGDIGVALVDEPHQITATGDTPLICLAIMAQPFNMDDVYC